MIIFIFTNHLYTPYKKSFDRRMERLVSKTVLKSSLNGVYLLEGGNLLRRLVAKSTEFTIQVSFLHRNGGSCGALKGCHAVVRLAVTDLWSKVVAVA